MKYTDIMIFFISLFLLVYSILFIHNNLETATNRANNLYARYIATACQDAMELNGIDGIDLKNDLKKSKLSVWNSSKVREDTVNTFYKSFALSLNKEGDAYYNNMELMTPVVCLIDVDGYYLSYNAAYDDFSTSDANYQNLHNITNLNTWSEKVGGYIIRYYLSDRVQIIKPDGTLEEGDRHEVYRTIQDITLEYLIQDDIFEEKKNACVIQTINKQLEYYINNVNNKADEYDTQYVITMPEIKGETWFGLVDQPAICAFVQGSTLNIRNNKVSVYGFGIYEMGEPLHYFMVDTGSGSTYYCLEEKEYQGEIGWGTDYPVFRGITIKELFMNKEDCAKEGAYPGA